MYDRCVFNTWLPTSPSNSWVFNSTSPAHFGPKFARPLFTFPYHTLSSLNSLSSNSVCFDTLAVAEVGLVLWSWVSTAKLFGIREVSCRGCSAGYCLLRYCSGLADRFDCPKSTAVSSICTETLNSPDHIQESKQVEVYCARLNCSKTTVYHFIVIIPIVLLQWVVKFEIGTSHYTTH